MDVGRERPAVSGFVWVRRVPGGGSVPDRVELLDAAGDPVLVVAFADLYRLAGELSALTREILADHPEVAGVVAVPAMTAADLTTAFEGGRQAGIRHQIGHGSELVRLVRVPGEGSRPTAAEERVVAFAHLPVLAGRLMELARTITFDVPGASDAQFVEPVVTAQELAVVFDLGARAGMEQADVADAAAA